VRPPLLTGPSPHRRKSSFCKVERRADRHRPTPLDRPPTRLGSRRFRSPVAHPLRLAAHPTRFRPGPLTSRATPPIGRSADVIRVDLAHQSRSGRAMMGAVESARGHLLVATPQLMDPNFARSVVLVLEHSEDGALGVVLNRPSSE